MGNNTEILKSFSMLLRSGHCIGHQIQDDQCAVCMDILYKPIKLKPCNHIFCEPCVSNLRSTGIYAEVTCPTCRTNIELSISDFQKNEHLELEYHDETERRKGQNEEENERLSLPRRRIWYECITMFVWCTPIDCLIVFLVQLMAALYFIESMLDEISWFIMFRQARLKGILEKIRKFCMFSLRCQLYEKWKRGIAMLSGIALTGVLISISQYD